MGKKDPAEMAKQRDIFMAGAAEHKFHKDRAGELFDLMEKFAGYGFNKSHSAAYALLAYHTAWLKTHYPVEFMAALLTSETSKPENVVKYISECREMNIPVVPPNVQVSDANFTPIVPQRRIHRLRSRRHQERRPQRHRIHPQPHARNCEAAGKQGFSTLWEFCERVDLRLLNKRVLESLIKAGAMDAFGPRAAVIGRPRQSHGARPEIPARRSRRPARSLRHVRRLTSAIRITTAKTRSPPCPNGTNTHACKTKKKSSASSSPATPWTSTAKSSAT